MKTIDEEFKKDLVEGFQTDGFYPDGQEVLEWFKSYLKNFADSVKLDRKPFEQNGEKYPDARWQKENYGAQQYNQALTHHRAKIAKELIASGL